MPTSDASHSTSKDFVKFGNARMKTLVSLCLRATKVYYCFSFHLNLTYFLAISLRGATKVLKSLTNLL